MTRGTGSRHALRKTNEWKWDSYAPLSLPLIRFAQCMPGTCTACHYLPLWYLTRLLGTIAPSSGWHSRPLESCGFFHLAPIHHIINPTSPFLSSPQSTNFIKISLSHAFPKSQLRLSASISLSLSREFPKLFTLPNSKLFTEPTPRHVSVLYGVILRTLCDLLLHHPLLC